MREDDGNGWCGEVGVSVQRWVWECVDGCGEVCVGWWVWGWGCGEVGVGVGDGSGEVDVGLGVVIENPTPVQKFTLLEPHSIISSMFVQSLITDWSYSA